MAGQVLHNNLIFVSKNSLSFSNKKFWPKTKYDSYILLPKLRKCNLRITFFLPMRANLSFKYLTTCKALGDDTINTGWSLHTTWKPRIILVFLSLSHTLCGILQTWPQVSALHLRTPLYYFFQKETTVFYCFFVTKPGHRICFGHRENNGNDISKSSNISVLTLLLGPWAAMWSLC